MPKNNKMRGYLKLEKETREEKEEQPVMTENATESNKQQEIQEEKAVEEKPGLTMEEAGGIEPLFNAYLRKEKVQFPPWLIETKKGVEILPQKLFAYIKKKQPTLSIKLGNSKGIVLYRYKDGKYIRWTESDCKSYIKSFLPLEIRKPSDWERVYKEFMTERADTDESELNADETIINFENGILNITTGEITQHTPEHKSTIQIPCKYKPNLQLAKAPYFNKFLIDITGGDADDIQTILEVIGGIISNIPIEKFKKAIILKGKGNTGKSVLRETIIRIIGDENNFTVDIASLNSRFGGAGIEGKRLIRKSEI